jgi:ATP-dependent Lhr-like helicase
MAQKREPVLLALGGRGWRLVHLDWTRKIAHVEPAKEKGKSRWMGSSIPLSPALCSTVRDLLKSTEQRPEWSRRAVARLEELRAEFSPFCGEGTVIARRGLSLEWWTFAGLAANQTMVQYLQPHFKSTLRADNLWITLPPDTSREELNRAIEETRSTKAMPDWQLQQPAADLLKFSDLLPEKLFQELIVNRIADIPRAQEILQSPIAYVHLHEFKG